MGHQNFFPFFFFCRYNGIQNATKMVALEKYWGLRNLEKKKTSITMKLYDKFTFFNIILSLKFTSTFWVRCDFWEINSFSQKYFEGLVSIIRFFIYY